MSASGKAGACPYPRENSTENGTYAIVPRSYSALWRSEHLTATALPLVLLSGIASAQGTVVLRVDKDQTTNPADGLFWSSAYPTLTAALAEARTRFTNGTPGDEVGQIWVAEGVYKPTSSTTDRTATFELVPGARVYGGFLGLPNGESTLGARAGSFTQTILSGDIDGDPRNQLLDSLHVVTVDNEAGGFRLDGFQVMLGAAVPNPSTGSPSTDNYGGGLLVDGVGGSTEVVVTNVTFQACLAGIGGGAYAQEADLSISRSSFSACIAYLSPPSGMAVPGGTAGALMVNACNPTYIYHTTFANNRASYGGAVGLISGSTQARIVNCLLTNNTAFAGGALLVSNTTAPVVVDFSTFSANLALAPGDGQTASFLGGGAIHIRQATDSLEVRSSIVWGNTDQNQVAAGSNTIAGAGAIPAASAGLDGVIVTYSDFDIGAVTPNWFASIPGVSASGSNITVDPVFVNAGLGNYRLKLNSPCIDAADDVVFDTAAVPAGSGASAWNGGLGDIVDVDEDGLTAEFLPWDLDFLARELDRVLTVNTGRDYAATPRIGDMGCYEFQNSDG